ncbi:MAG: CaiB/BaiF CoA transferase family protein [Solirubrobacteraceae bacterium]
MADALAGIRVLDFTQAWAGPLCTQTLADFGADVVKVESETRPDVSRMMGPYPEAADVDLSGYFLELNRNKRSVALNLRLPEEVEIARRLAEQADVVVENFAPGVLDRLGLGYDVLKETRPDLVMLSISGFGATGPDRAAVAFGQQIEAESGLMSLTGYGDGVPMKPGVSYPDPVAGVAGVGAVMAALLHRDRTGEGQWIDLSMLEITAALLVQPLMEYARTGVSPAATGNASALWSPHGIYPATGEDRWIAIECDDEEQWRALASRAGLGWEDDPRFASNAERLAYRGELDAALGAWTAGQDRDAIADELQAAGVPAAAVADVADLHADPHLRARGWWQTVEHARAGRLDLQGPPARLTATPARVRLAPPLLGEHTEAVKAELARA